VRRLLRSRLALGALALVLVSAAATTVALATRDGRPADFACTMVGYANIISIDFGLHFPKQQRELRAFEERYVRRHRGFPARGDAFTRRLVAALPVRRAAICTAGRCRDVPLESFLRDFPRLASVPVHSTDPVHVSVVVDRRSQPLQLASGTVRPRSSEPNGRGCGFWFHGSAKVDGSVVRDVSS
jgi:hypothetical protein